MKEFEFHVKHGINTSNRLVPKIMEAISMKLSEGVYVDGTLYRVEKLGDIIERSGTISLLFDVKNIDVFDHIEFEVKKTGWGRSMVSEEGK